MRCAKWATPDARTRGSLPVDLTWLTVGRICPELLAARNFGHRVVERSLRLLTVAWCKLGPSAGTRKIVHQGNAETGHS